MIRMLYLITPHGDLKRSNPRGASSGSGTSLPLMGI